jgi:putative multiple sugar transport system ATP-binding protein
VLLISSELPELLGLSDRIYTLFEGAITNEFSTAQTDPETLMKSMTSRGSTVPSSGAAR